MLGTLPTSGGKSLCYQTPALSRCDKTGALTVVVSPLVELMIRTGGGARGPEHRLLRHRQRAAVHARASRCVGPGAAARRWHRHRLAGSGSQRITAPVVGTTGDRRVGAGRGPLPLQLGGTTSGPITVTGAASFVRRRERSRRAGVVPDRDRQAGREGRHS